LQPLVIFIVMLPLLTSVVVRTFAWIVILGRQGIVNNTLGAWAGSTRPSSCCTRGGGWSWRWPMCSCR
jgi:putative spermidine/putrescine transport system permease protein